MNPHEQPIENGFGNAHSLDLAGGMEDEEEHEEYLEKLEKKNTKVKIALYGSLAGNVILLGVQIFICISSKSLSMLATLVDAIMDIVAGVILVYTTHAAKSRHFLIYPTGKKRIETVGTIVFSVLMATLSAQLITEAVRSLTDSGEHSAPNLTLINVIPVLFAILMKAGLFLYCYTLREYSTVRTFLTDHRNDVILNSFALLAAYLSMLYSHYIDPVGAILLALYIICTWASEAYSQIKLIVGISADPEFLTLVTYIALTHHEKIQYVDTVKAYHAGEHLYVEVDVVMDRNTELWISHDVGESLQTKLENLKTVARAFVHVDYEFTHSPEHRLH
ncbi:Metal tolerance protein 9 [Zancudomyces culisetae]|uniref:Metal tolerance protein 9 n=1 Tax=Zancudomyces culisetae TaxID=1213189 RepID=A0A1R1PTM6_ZANCU|nr:Metal tolerance protein 9 [Zancudomyces culisetae]|eukprot:OMH84242.1 Metal tolerance protein 9 [Zancudomyces culisetae]